MRRIYFLLPDVECAGAIVKELLLARVEWRHIHLMANDNTALDSLPEASFAQKSDLVPALQRGLVFGTAMGFIAGFLLVAFPIEGLHLSPGVTLLFTFAGAGFGAWVATMIGVHLPSSRLARFAAPLQQGQLLLMIDVPASRVEEIEALVNKHHPEASLHGTENMIPAFP